MVGKELADNERDSSDQTCGLYCGLLGRTGVPRRKAGSAGLSVKQQQHNMEEVKMKRYVSTMMAGVAALAIASSASADILV